MPAPYLTYVSANLTRVLDLPESPDIIPGPDGNFYVQYTDLHGVTREWVYEPTNKVSAELTVSVGFDPESQMWVYHYAVSVSESSPQGLDRFGIRYDGVEICKVSRPEGWSVSYQIMGQPVIAWGEDVYGHRGLPPGHRQTGFELRSPCGPGTVKFYMRGYTDIPSFAYGEAPEDPRPKFFGDVAVGETIGPVAASVAGQLSPDAEWVSLREALTAAGWQVEWDADSQIATARSGTDVIVVQADNAAAQVNEHPLVLGARPRLRLGVLEVPRTDLPGYLRQPPSRRCRKATRTPCVAYPEDGASPPAAPGSGLGLRQQFAYLTATSLPVAADW